MKTLLIIAAIVLIVHGLIHLMGTASYLKLTEIGELPYKTTLLNGSWDLGTKGIALFGVLWAVATVGFVAAGVAMIAGWSWWQPLLLGVTLFSLVLTALDYKVAYAGVIINVVILAVVLLGPRVAGWFSR
jgi:hypothetical protein